MQYKLSSGFLSFYLDEYHSNSDSNRFSISIITAGSIVMGFFSLFESVVFEFSCIQALDRV